jgi:predicted Zn-dependent protease
VLTTEGAPPPTPPKGGFVDSQSGSRSAKELVFVIAALLLAGWGLLRGAGCAAEGIAGELPPSVDASIGKAAASSVAGQFGEVDATPEDDARARRLFDEVVAALTPDERARLEALELHVLGSEQVNAFALPGGQVFVLTGLLRRAGDDDDVVRGVLAHELGHAVRRHGLRSIAREQAVGIALGLFFGGDDARIAALVQGASSLSSLAYSRSMEDEADAFAVELLARTGHDPSGLARFLEGLESQPGPELLSTHPDSAERARAVRERAPK